jgi:predicted transcriptional regulator
MKELLMDMVEMYDDDYTIKQISDITGMPQDVVFDILQRYSLRVVLESDTLQ